MNEKQDKQNFKCVIDKYSEVFEKTTKAKTDFFQNTKALKPSF